ncbi:MAG TPA: glutathione S-transferase N-terminal domain-containing protein [Solirubrobacterales bacterium]|nr:glutathione S-transferase N-terminal domain-containing protein [Solirubrobacterales bacterium]
MGSRLYVIPASHPATTAALMLDFKGIAYKRTDLMPVVSKGVLRAAGFPRVTVPALKIDGERIQGSREIARALDRIKPEPPLFPADPARRAAVEAAERFGDEELQHPLRQLLWWGFKHEKENLRSYSEGARLGVPIGLAIKTGGPLVALSARFNEASDANARAALAALPDLLDRVDAYIADGTIAGEEPNAADFQIATSIALALTLDDLKPLIEPRPAAALARRIAPDYPGHTPPIFPPAWLPMAPAAA